MLKTELYSLLFTDSLVANLAINTTNEFVIHSMKIFGGYSNIIMIFVSVSAASVAILLNYIFGRMLFNMFKYTEAADNVRCNQFELFFKKYRVLFFSLAIVPLYGNFIPLIAGFVRHNFLQTIFLTIIVKCFYYIFIVYNEFL